MPFACLGFSKASSGQASLFRNGLARRWQPVSPWTSDVRQLQPSQLWSPCKRTIADGRSIPYHDAPRLRCSERSTKTLAAPVVSAQQQPIVYDPEKYYTDEGDEWLLDGTEDETAPLPASTLLQTLESVADARVGPAIYRDPTKDDAPRPLHDDYYGRAVASLEHTDTEREIVEKHSIELAATLARHIRRSLHSKSQDTTENTVDISPNIPTADIHVLDQARCNADDLKLWAAILTTKKSSHAVDLLLNGNNGSFTHADVRRIPSFVLLHLLHRQWLSSYALQHLINHVTEWAEHKVVTDPRRGRVAVPKNHTPPTELNPLTSRLEDLPVDHLVRFQAFSLLLRHARQIWPESLEAIVSRAASCLYSSPSIAGSSLDQDEQMFGLVVLFNRLLSAVAKPISVEPYKGIMYQENAQAYILQHMAEQDPPLHINRQGYRAVFRVQLARRKTEQEQEWTSLKAPSWPPWKEERTGMDALIGPEQGISRAGRVLLRMQEAGYALGGWEQVAMIYSGWDTDSTPTIQTRIMLPDLRSKDARPYIWAARIRCTRTIQEAWACFLAWEDEKIRPHHEVYLAMMEKAHYEDLRLSRLSFLRRSSGMEGIVRPILAGDAKEVFPLPKSVHQETYTRSKPPSVAQLFRQMMDRGVKLSDRARAFLLSTAPSVKSGTEYLNSGPAVNSEDLDNWPPTKFAAWIKLLARFPHKSNHDDRSHAQSRRFRIGPWTMDTEQPIARAFYLLVTHKPRYKPAWNQFFRALAFRSGMVVKIPSHTPAGTDAFLVRNKQSIHQIVPLDLLRQALAIFDELDLALDSEGFIFLCMVFVNAVQASRLMLVEVERRNGEGFETAEGESLSPAATKLLDQARALIADRVLIQHEFYALVGNPVNAAAPSDPLRDGSLVKDLPRLFVTPKPGLLHQYVRALGSLEDWQGMLDLVNLLKEHWTQVESRKAEDRSGDLMFRRMLVAIRTFVDLGHDYVNSLPKSSLEQDPEVADSFEAATSTVAPQGVVTELTKVIDSMPEWGGWPSEAEVALYIANGTQERKGKMVKA